MSYLAIYRKFRPTTFDEVIGQESIVKTLINQINTDRVGHAYLFAGARGTGKTTCAKIFARAINCQNPKNGSPCFECQACKQLDSQTNMDILEIDAASNNKVENIRDIRDSVQYPPVAGKYKVYIIDEVHMLTPEAYNALLKTLEEPPKHVVFILATTEPNKLPATILSRCMRFDFKLVSDKVISDHVKKIFDKVGKKYEDEAINLIAKSGEGSVRDALSVADLCLSTEGDTLTYKQVVEILGASDSQKTYSLLNSVLSSDIGGTLSIIDELLSLGKSVSVLSKDLLNMIRDTLVVKTCKNAKSILMLPDDEYNNLLTLSNLAEEHRFLRILELLTSLEGTLRYSTHPRVLLETALIKATMPEQDYNIDALLSRVTKLENALKNGEFKVSKEPQVIENVIEKIVEKPVEMVIEKPIKEVETKIISDDELPIPPIEEEPLPIVESESKEPIKSENVSESKEPLTGQNVNKVADSRLWGSVIHKLKENNEIMLWIACQELDGKIENGTLIVTCQDDNEYKHLTKQENYAKLEKIVDGLSGYKIKVVMSGEGIEPTESDVDKVKKVFPNVKVID